MHWVISVLMPLGRSAAMIVLSCRWGTDGSIAKPEKWGQSARPSTLKLRCDRRWSKTLGEESGFAKSARPLSRLELLRDGNATRPATVVLHTPRSAPRRRTRRLRAD